MMRKRDIVVLSTLLLFIGLANATVPGFEYYSAVTIHNPNGYPIYKYPVSFDVALPTDVDTNSIDVTLTTQSGELEIPFSYDADGNVAHITAYVDEIPAHGTITLYVYMGGNNVSGNRVAKTEMIGKYWAVRLHDSVLLGDDWTPSWDEIRQCYKTYWSDGGRDAFDGFLHPRIYIGFNSRRLRVSPYSNCQPQSFTLHGIRFKVYTYAYGPSTAGAYPHNPSAHQRVWYQEVLPRCDYRNQSVYEEYRVSGNLGSDDETHEWEFEFNWNGMTLRYFETSDKQDPNAGGYGRPQIHYFALPLGTGQYDQFTIRGSDRPTHKVADTTIPTVAAYALFVGDVHQYVEDWLKNSLYLGAPCYMDHALEITVGSPEHIDDFAVTYPHTVYRGHDFNVEVLYTGSGSISISTDSGTVTGTTTQDSTHIFTVSVPTTVTLGEHNISVLIDGNVAWRGVVNVAEGGIPNILSVDSPQTFRPGEEIYITPHISCDYDSCDAAIRIYSPSCYQIGNYEINIDHNSTVQLPVGIVCFGQSQSDVNVVAYTPAGSSTYQIHLDPAPTNTYPATISSQDIVNNDGNYYVTVSVGGGYEGNVYLYVLQDGSVIQSYSQAGNGNYTFLLRANELPPGQYILLASGNGFSIEKPILVTPTYSNKYGVLVSDQFGKPVSILNADTNAEYAEITVDLQNEWTHPITIDVSDWLQHGGILQLPQQFATVLDTITVMRGNSSYEVAYDAKGGGFAVVWSGDGQYLALDPGDNLFTIRFKSPFVSSLKDMCDNSNDQTVCGYYADALDANKLSEQMKYYYLAEQYLQSAMYGGISVEVVAPPTIIQGTSARAFIYIKSGSGAQVDPDTLSCNIINISGSTIGDCNTTHISQGVYALTLPSNAVGTFGIRVTAVKSTHTSESAAYYTVSSRYTPGDISITNFVVPPNGKTTVIYAQDPSATVNVSLYSNDGTLITSGTASYNNDIGAFVYEINVGPVPAGDYVVVVSDSFGYKKQAVIHVSPILQNILATVSDVNSFISGVLYPKVQDIYDNTNTIINNQNNLYASVQELNSQAISILQTIQNIQNEINSDDSQIIASLSELNKTTHEILDTVNYIKSKIDTEVLTKLDQIYDSQTDLNAQIQDIKSMINCETQSAVCLQLNNLELMVSDLNTNISLDYNGVMQGIYNLNSKADTIQQYVNDISNMLDCNYAYPSSSVCARLDDLRDRANTISGNIEDMNMFLNHIYDYVRNDLTSEVVAVGSKVDDLNAYLHGDVWAKLVSTYNKVNGLYDETNTIKYLISNHNAIVRAQLDSLQQYLQDVNTTIVSRLANLQSHIDSKLSNMSDSIESISADTNLLINYFNCTSPNDVCDKLQNIYNSANDISANISELNENVYALHDIEMAKLGEIIDYANVIDSNIASLKNLLTCEQMPQYSVCQRLDMMHNELSEINSAIEDINGTILHLYHRVEQQIEAVHTIAGGGGGGGLAAIEPIKVVYKFGHAYIAIPKYVPSGKYTVEYTGDLFRYVVSPKPGSKVDLSDGILRLKLSSDAKGVLSGEVRLIRGVRTYRISVNIVADDSMNQKVAVASIGGILTIDVPKGGASVEFSGPVASCVPAKRLFFKTGGVKKIKLSCNSDGVVIIEPLNGSLKQTQIPIVRSSPDIVAASDMLHTTVVPIVAFLAIAYIITTLGLI